MKMIQYNPEKDYSSYKAEDLRVAFRDYDLIDKTVCGDTIVYFFRTNF